MSVVGIAWVFQMISPVLRCHHKSGSLNRDRTVKTPSTTTVAASITGNENTVWDKLRAGCSPATNTGPAVVMEHRDQSTPRAFYFGADYGVGATNGVRRR